MSDAGMHPHSMTQSQHVAAADFADHLMTTAEVKQLERVKACHGCCQQRVLHHFNDPVIQNTPVALL